MHSVHITEHFSPAVTRHVAGASFSRLGGGSPAPYDSLNISFGVGDSSENVFANRQKLNKILSIDYLVSARQIHGDTIFCLTDAAEQDLEVDGYDALITTVAGAGLMVQQADCQAVMLFDPEQRVVANIHSGWRGSVANIIGKTIQRMGDFETTPENIRAAISPSLGSCCAEFVNYKTELPHEFHSFQVQPNHFDFWAISGMQLTGAGVLPENIFNPRICTVCDTNYFSYRREGTTGRSASIIALR